MNREKSPRPSAQSAPDSGAPVGLYLHLPFCLRRCLYCDFYSTAGLDREDDYVLALCRHIREAGGRLGRIPADTVYFGGGTPSLLKAKNIEKLLGALSDCFSLSDPEITLEANPATLDRDKIRALKSLGVNRVSLGMQSACDRELAAIGRLHTAEEALKTADLILSEGIQRLNLDLMYALPYQSRESFRQSAEAAAKSGADHVSCYCLTLSPEVPLAGMKLPQAEESQQLEMYMDACEILERQGIFQYEISNFARPGQESRHNLKYWRRTPTLGFGAGAYSFYGNRRWAVKADLEAVIAEESRNLITDEVILTPEDEAEEVIMLSLRLTSGLDYDRLRAVCTPENYQARMERIRKKLALWEKLGLTEETNSGFRLTKKGFFVSNSILADLI